MAQQKARQRNDRGEGQRLRAEIVAAATAVVDDEGPAALSLRRVARAAGIAAPSIYPHFSNLAAVTDAVLAASFAELHEAVTTSIDGHAESTDALIAGCAAYVHYGWRHRHRFQLMFTGAGYAPDALATFDALKAAIAACVHAKAATSTDLHRDAFLVWVALHGLAVLEKPSRAELRRLGPIDREGAVAELVRRIAHLG